MTTGLRERRQRAGLSQQRLAELAGCSVSMLRLLEGGMRPAESEVLPRVEALLAEHEAASNVPTAPGATSSATDREAA